MSAKHTPGPWETTVLADGSEWGICEAGGGNSIAWVDPTADPEEEQANAALIAEAPAMLAALERLLADPYLSDPINNDRMDSVRATIARAKGEA